MKKIIFSPNDAVVYSEDMSFIGIDFGVNVDNTKGLMHSCDGVWMTLTNANKANFTDVHKTKAKTLAEYQDKYPTAVLYTFENPKLLFEWLSK